MAVQLHMVVVLFPEKTPQKLIGQQHTLRYLAKNIVAAGVFSGKSVDPTSIRNWSIETTFNIYQISGRTVQVKKIKDLINKNFDLFSRDKKCKFK